MISLEKMGNSILLRVSAASLLTFAILLNSRMKCRATQDFEFNANIEDDLEVGVNMHYLQVDRFIH